MATEPGRIGGHVDLVIVGGGPAGMAAAVTVLDGGGTVCLIDGGHRLGGQFWRQPGGPGVAGLGPATPDATYRRLAGALEQHRISGRLDPRLRHHAWTVTRADDGVAVHVMDRSRAGRRGDGRAAVVTGRALLIATGAHDRHLPFPGWDLPGVFSAGGMQALLKGNGVSVGTRVVVGGTGPFLLPVAAGLARAGVRVRVLEANDPRRWARHVRAALGIPGKAAEAIRYAAVLSAHRVPVSFRSAVVAAHGTDRVEAVTIARLDRSGRLIPDSGERIDVDAVGVGWGFTPQLDLAVTLGCELTDGPDGNEVVAVDAGQRSSVPGVLVAGEACGVGGAELAVAEGHLAGATVLDDLTGGLPTDHATREPVVHPSPREVRAWRSMIRRHRAFATAMWDAHPLPAGWTDWLTDATVVCRCEEVDVATVRAATAAGASGPRQLKQLTRVGMGLCQGRICSTAAACLAPGGSGGLGDAGRVPASERLVADPVPLGALRPPT